MNGAVNVITVAPVFAQREDPSAIGSIDGWFVQTLIVRPRPVTGYRLITVV